MIRNAVKLISDKIQCGTFVKPNLFLNKVSTDGAHSRRSFSPPIFDFIECTSVSRGVVKVNSVNISTSYHAKITRIINVSTVELI